MVKQERTGWRDEGLSRRHRCWGDNLCLVDNDCIWIECNGSEPCALFEWVNEHGEKITRETFKIKVLKRLGEKSNLPAFLLRYADDYSWYQVHAINQTAKNILPEPKKFTELEYVTFLNKLRGKSVDSLILAANIGWEIAGASNA